MTRTTTMTMIHLAGYDASSQWSRDTTITLPQEICLRSKVAIAICSGQPDRTYSSFVELATDLDIDLAHLYDWLFEVEQDDAADVLFDVAMPFRWTSFSGDADDDIACYGALAASFQRQGRALRLVPESKLTHSTFRGWYQRN